MLHLPLSYTPTKKVLVNSVKIGSSGKSFACGHLPGGVKYPRPLMTQGEGNVLLIPHDNMWGCEIDVFWRKNDTWGIG